MSPPPSPNLQSLPPFPCQVTKFQTILETASGADQTVRQKFESHKEAIVLLGKPVGELQAALPKAGALSSRVQGSQVRWHCEPWLCCLIHCVLTVCTRSAGLDGGSNDTEGRERSH